MAWRAIVGLLAGALIGLSAIRIPAADRAVAVTVDDLPGAAGSLVANDAATVRATNDKLLATLRAAGVPAVGFVNENKLFVSGEAQAQTDARIAILKAWVDAGFELGNHTYSHPDLNTTPRDTFEADVIKGEIVTRRLLEAKGGTLRYFRHPFLHVGLELEKRRAFEAFLAQRGYTIAPVTVDTEDYIYAAIYADALRRGDRELAARIGRAYVQSMTEAFGFAEGLSRNVTGREIKQIVLLHVNAINADYFAEVAAEITKRGYRFVTLEDALTDPAYRLPNTYVGRWGLSWLHHWELTAGKPRTPSPDPPDWVLKAYQARTASNR